MYNNSALYKVMINVFTSGNDDVFNGFPKKMKTFFLLHDNKTVGNCS